MLPRGTILGSLVVVEVYETHDIPRLFLAANNTGQQFIALWIDFDDESEIWLYLAVSAPRLQLIRTGGIDLRTAYRESELGAVWEATTSLKTGEWRTRDVPASDIADALLPDEGERIRVAEDAPLEIRSASLDELVVGSKRDALAVALYYSRNYRYEAPVRELGQFMEALQEQLDVLGQNQRGKFGPGGSVSPEVLLQTQIVFSSTYPSSFGMKLVASLPADLAGESLAASAIKELIEIMSMTAEQLPEFLKNTHNRVAVKYRRLLSTLVDNEAGVRLAWQTPGSRQLVQMAMTLDRVIETYAIVSAVEDEEVKEIRIQGILTGVQIRTHNYEITTADKKRYAGKILASAYGQAASATMSQLYDAVIHMTTEVATATGAEKIHYFLVDLKKVG